MARKKRPNTAQVILSFRVPKGMSARMARHIVWNNVDTNIFLDTMEEEAMGVGELKMKVGKAKIVRPVAV